MNTNERNALTPEYNGFRPPTIIAIENFDDDFDDEAEWFRRRNVSFSSWWYQVSPCMKVFYILTCVVLALALVIGLTVGLTAPIPNRTPPNSAGTSSSQTNTIPKVDATTLLDEPIDRESNIIAKLEILTSSDLLLNNSTPQNVAFRWIVDSDAMQLQSSNPFLIQRYATAALYFSLSGSSWKSHWIEDSVDMVPECLWHGIECDEDNQIVFLFLNDLGLRGQIPSEISALSHLKKLDLRDNSLSGTLPDEMGKLQHLNLLLLTGNEDLSGPMIDGICQHVEWVTATCEKIECNCCANCNGKNLTIGINGPIQSGDSSGRVVDIDGLIGRLSPSAATAGSPQNSALNWILYGDEKKLQVNDETLIQRYSLAVFYYALGGPQWPTASSWLTANSECQYTGVACNEFGFVTTIALVDNKLKGSLPEEIGLLDQLTMLDLTNNQISETIPIQLSELEDLESLLLHDNAIIGMVPSQICELRQVNLKQFTTDCEADNVKVKCGCCTNCENSLGSIQEREDGNHYESESQSKLDYLAIFGRRGELVAQALEAVSEDVYTENSAQADATEWILKEDPMSLDHDDKGLIQRWVLALMYYQLDGANWLYKNFRNGNSECDWDQITCDDNGQVTEIRLTNGGLLGRVPYELGALDNLRVLDLHGNRIEGQAPEEFCVEETDSSFALEVLIFDCESPALVECDCCTPCTDESSPIMSNFASEQLDYLALFGNRGQRIAKMLEDVSEAIYTPDSNSAAAAKWIIQEDVLQLEHSDPHLIQRFVLALLYFELDGNNWVYKNFLSGEECIWDGITCDTNGVITSIILPNGGLMGSVPNELGALDGLKALDLHGNRIEGKVPDDLCVEETDSSFALEILIFDCLNPPLVECDCCTPCPEEINLPGSVNNIDYQGMFGARGQSIVKLLEGVSEDIYASGSASATAAEWMIKEDPQAMDPTDPRLVQRYVLALTYFMLDGKNWLFRNFLTAANECEWDGISCNQNDEVTGIVLPNGGLLGIVPYELGTLSMLSTVDLHGNRIEGKVPDELCVEETDAAFALKTLIFDCIEPPLVECDCCTPCSSDQGVDQVTSSSSEASQAVDYQSIAGDRGVQIAQVLEGASSDVTVKGSSAAEAAIWLARSDPMMMAPDDTGLLQRWILTMMYYELDGPNWENADSFLTGESECQWEGIMCNTANKVTHIVLPSKGLVGLIPPELADLDDLNTLDLRGNRLEGEVPVDLCDDRAISVLVVDCSTMPLVYCACCTPCN